MKKGKKTSLGIILGTCIIAGSFFLGGGYDKLSKWYFNLTASEYTKNYLKIIR